jgi:predicted Zn-dependent peptidase
MSVRITQLASGMTVVTHAMDQLESAALGVWVKAGSRSERIEEHGMAHLLEHMAFKGTRTRSAVEIAEAIEAVGGEVNAATSTETTSYYARLLKNDVPLGIDILSDILRNSVFDAEELKREQHVIVQEIGAAQDTPEDRVYDLFIERAYPNQPLGRPILGTEETVRSATPKGLATYLDRHYRGPSMVFAAAGAVNHDQVVDLVAKGFDGLGSDAGPVPAAAAYSGGEKREQKDLMEAQILLGFEGVSYLHEDFHTAQILASVLGGGMSSRLFQEVREKRGLCYSIYSFHWSFQETGVFGVHAATGEEDVAELTPVVLGELERAAADIAEVELRRARAQMRAGLLMTLESPAGRAGQLARQILLFGRPLSFEEQVAKIDAVTAEDVRRLAAKLFTRGTPTIAAVGPVAGLIDSGRISARLGTRAAA